MHLTSGSVFILGNDIGTGPTSSSASETSSTFMMMAGLASPDVGIGSPHGSRTSLAEFVQFCKKNHIFSSHDCTTPLHETGYALIAMALLHLIWLMTFVLYGFLLYIFQKQ
jgi:hypothetical protein